MNFVKMLGNVALAWGMLYLLGAFVSADWDSYYWSEFLRFMLALVAFFIAVFAYGCRNLEEYK